MWKAFLCSKQVKTGASLLLGKLFKLAILLILLELISGLLCLDIRAGRLITRVTDPGGVALTCAQFHPDGKQETKIFYLRKIASRFTSNVVLSRANSYFPVGQLANYQ
jgi:hypothetical protein